MKSTKADQEKWKKIIQTAYGSGIGVRGWCREHDVSEKQFYYWRKKLSLQPERSLNEAELVEIQPPVSTSEDEEAVLECGEIKLVIRRHASQETIEKVIRALKNA